MDDGWVESCAKVFITIIVSNLIYVVRSAKRQRRTRKRSMLVSRARPAFAYPSPPHSWLGKSTG
jgi:hypothetical protein